MIHFPLNNLTTFIVDHLYCMYSTPTKVVDVFTLVQILFSGQSHLDEEDFAEEQNLVSKMIVLLGQDVEDSETHFVVLKEAMTFVLKGGEKRLPYTCPPLLFNILQLLRSVTICGDKIPSSLEDADGAEDKKKSKKTKTASKKLLQMANTCLTSLASTPSDKAKLLRLYLTSASLADECEQEAIAYEFFSQALLIYEEEISISREQISSLHLLIGSLSKCRNFEKENLDSLIHKTTVFSSRLLRKEDQCRMAYACSHLFWGSKESHQDGEAVMKCLKRALKTAKAFQDIAAASQEDTRKAVAYAYTTKALYVEILNKYIYYFEKGCAEITPTVLQGLIEVVKEELASCDLSEQAELQSFYQNTLKHVRLQKTKDDAISERYAEIDA